LRRTRLHATTRNAGSYTRFARSSKRRPGSAIAHRCNFVCIASTRCSASSRSGHDAQVFTSDLPATKLRCEHAGPLRHVRSFPALRLLRVLRPIPTASIGDGPSHLLPGPGDREGPSGWFPRSLSNRLTGSAPSYALQHRHGYAAAIHRGLPVGDVTRPRSSPHNNDVMRVRAALQPRSARFELVGLLRSVQSLVPHVHLSVLLAGPGPSGSTDPSRRCQGCCPPSLSSQRSGCPQLQRLAATSRRRCPFTTARFKNASWRSKSHTHKTFGRSARKLRLTRSGART